MRIDLLGYIVFLFISNFYDWATRFGQSDDKGCNPKSSSRVRGWKGFRKITFAPWLHPT